MSALDLGIADLAARIRQGSLSPVEVVRESLERIQQATGELEQRLAEVESHDAKLMELIERAYANATALRQRAERGPELVSESPDAVDTESGGAAALLQGDGLALP